MKKWQVWLLVGTFILLVLVTIAVGGIIWHLVRSEQLERRRQHREEIERRRQSQEEDKMKDEAMRKQFESEAEYERLQRERRARPSRRRGRRDQEEPSDTDE